MTTLAPTAPKIATGSTRHTLTGTGILIRLNLRRERIPLLVWILGIGAVAFAIFSAFVTLFPDEPPRLVLAGTVSANPALLALTGPVLSTSIGGLTAWRISVLGTTLVGLMAIFTVIRRTRADEEAGRTELLGSCVVGRSAPLAAAVIVATGASTLIGVLMAAAGIANGQDVTGSIVLGASMAGCGLFFAGVAAVAAQLAETARTATAIASAVLAIGFALRAVGDVESSLSALTWLSPQGWAHHMGAYADNNFAILGLFLLSTVGLLLLAWSMLNRRDIGLAMFATRLGPASNPRLAGTGALAARLQRGPLIGWMVGFAFFGVIIGGIADSAADVLESNPQMGQFLAKLGGAGVLVDTFLSALGAIAGLIIGAFTISAALRMGGEETADRVGPLLATPVGRTRWMTGHLIFVVIGPVLVLATAGLIGGLVHGVRGGDMADGLTATLAAMLAQVPPVLVMGGLAVALFGWLPQFTSLAWAGLVVALLLGQLGPLLELPQVLMDISPYTHVPAVPAQEMRWMPVIVLLLVAAALIGAGIAGFKRRDVN